MDKEKFFLVAVLLVLLNFSCTNDVADFVILNGNVVTVDSKNSIFTAIAVKDQKILEIGSDADIKKLIGEKTEVLNLNGETVIPGFIESHAHFLGIGKMKQEIDLRNTRNWEEIVQIVKNKVATVKKGEWIIGRGWHQEKWDKIPENTVEGFPLHHKLSEISPDNPVILKHASGHAVFVNEVMLRLAGINKGTPNPSGGEILKDFKREPTGLLKENAEELVSELYKKSVNTDEIKEKTAQYLLANKECLSKGITSFHDAGQSFRTIDILKSLIDSGKKGVRLNVMMEESNDYLKKKANNYRLIGYGDNYLTVRSIKKYIDGALGSRGALFIKDYSDKPGLKGIRIIDEKELTETANIALENKLQLCIHSIGDSANRVLLKEYKKFYERSNSKDLRWRIEHAQHLSVEDISKFGEIGIIAAMQPVHCTSDAGFVLARIGEKRAKEGAYVWKSLIDKGTIICAGTDAPVEDVDPIMNFYSAVTRKTKMNNEFYPDQKMTRLDALKAFTINGAYAAFEEKIKGTIEKGKLADFTILSNDLLKVDDEKIPDTKILYTIVGGKILYQNKNLKGKK